MLLQFFDRIVICVATGGYVGYSPLVPATIGSFIGILLYLPMASEPVIVQLSVTSFLLGLGIWISGRAEKLTKIKDARLIVIDEIVGMWISLLFLPSRLSYVLSAFVLFRIFDVLKPFPANRAQRLNGGLGVMLDDVIAGLYTNAVLHLVLTLSADSL